MAKLIQATNNKITSLEKLDYEIHLVGNRLTVHKIAFKEKLADLPKEAVKKMVAVSASLLIAKSIASSTTSVINSGIRFLLNRKKTFEAKKAKTAFFKNMGKLGFFTAVKLAFNTLMNKKPTDII